MLFTVTSDRFNGFPWDTLIDKDVKQRNESVKNLTWGVWQQTILDIFNANSKLFGSA